jgi:hypothetical protein
MKITLSPIASSKDDELPQVNGDVITYRGESYDLSQLPEGATVEAVAPFVGQITRINGEVQLSVQYEYDSATAEPMQSTDKADYVLSEAPFACPIARKAPEVSEIEKGGERVD